MILSMWPKSNCISVTQRPISSAQRSREDGQVVVYTTSFKAVRGRYELCKKVVQTLHNHRVKVDERDILVSQEYHTELKERLNEKISVPQVFINGQHIGV